MGFFTVQNCCQSNYLCGACVIYTLLKSSGTPCEYCWLFKTPPRMWASTGAKVPIWTGTSFWGEYLACCVGKEVRRSVRPAFTWISYMSEFYTGHSVPLKIWENNLHRDFVIGKYWFIKMRKISFQCVALLVKYEKELGNCGNVLFKQFCKKKCN